MPDKNIAVFGMYRNQAEVETAVDFLKSAGFSNNDVSVLFPDNHGTHTFAHQKETKAPEGATVGVSTGVLLGGALGWLVGIGSLAIPGVGPFVAAGPIMAAMAGAGAGGVLGGVSGALIGLGIPEYEAKRYASYMSEGGILLSVHCQDSYEIQRAEELLKQTGATDIASSTESAPPKSKSPRLSAAVGGNFHA